jgi:hemin uptake protein HemP
MTKAEDAPKEQPKDEKQPAVPVVKARDLFVGGGREILIEHEGVRYRLRITRRNKLILQK